MSTKKEIWRLLEPGVDVWQEGDEYLASRVVAEWCKVTRAFIPVEQDHEVGRRRMTLPEPQGWISVKERMPTKEEYNKVLWWNGSVAYLNTMAIGFILAPTHWMPIPEFPKPVNPDEEAWEEWSKKNLMRNYSVGNAEADAALKEGFLAGRKSVATEKEDSHG